MPIIYVEGRGTLSGESTADAPGVAERGAGGQTNAGVRWAKLRAGGKPLVDASARPRRYAGGNKPSSRELKRYLLVAVGLVSVSLSLTLIDRSWTSLT